MANGRTVTDVTLRVENRIGTLAAIGEAVGRAGVNLEGATGFGEGPSGVVHLCADDAQRAMDALRNAGFSNVTSREAWLEVVPHQPGALGATARRLADAGVNIETFYIAAGGDGGVSVVFVVDDVGKARQTGG